MGFFMRMIGRIVRRVVSLALRPFGYLVVRFGENGYDPRDSILAAQLRFFLRVQENFAVADVLRASPLSKSQLGQDLFVLAALGSPRSGFFVEFGATNGFDLSNTYLLEKEFGWTGILAEPAARWLPDLTKNRAVAIDSRCVWSKSGEQLDFNETSVGEFSTLNAFSSSDGHSRTRRKGQVYSVETVSLQDLLEEHDAPKVIDYLSIDTEGSEFKILENFDFSRFSFRVVTVEHNFTGIRGEIHALLQRNGYERVYEDLSQWDDWYLFRG